MTRVRNACNTRVTHVQNVCDTLVTRVQNVCDTRAFELPLVGTVHEQLRV